LRSKSVGVCFSYGDGHLYSMVEVVGGELWVVVPLLHDGPSQYVVVCVNVCRDWRNVMRVVVMSHRLFGRREGLKEEGVMTLWRRLFRTFCSSCLSLSQLSLLAVLEVLFGLMYPYTIAIAGGSGGGDGDVRAAMCNRMIFALSLIFHKDNAAFTELVL